MPPHTLVVCCAEVCVRMRAGILNNAGATKDLTRAKSEEFADGAARFLAATDI